MNIFFLSIRDSARSGFSEVALLPLPTRTRRTEARAGTSKQRFGLDRQFCFRLRWIGQLFAHQSEGLKLPRHFNLTRHRAPITTTAGAVFCFGLLEGHG